MCEYTIDVYIVVGDICCSSNLIRSERILLARLDSLFVGLENCINLVFFFCVRFCDQVHVHRLLNEGKF